ncbi:hypothetical protein KL918_003751 [Ogataea parapolymorpha]|uniref:Serine/threonine-protein kinase psk1 n=1 Tax=Ogataea parapolymorpha (strain ATCC 26012 / BCRC 20466 / JCM 22074 / NRRL Y-7560 / DL-1) TaxID=871575 RepID=W1QLH4_OGAPD|nr:Serine/threonine-protein kinase psk1 [Ogataea parapolymorpha DL-1]ESX02206.1 Serine/threonine-protein kinase psk1 [Ogataea parapolymorpha DL-1]KAG7866286.1 hypothetical protein KL918_003751 [Ogataea parapolymorpha]KAG7872914.1 hypothetical protein KL916_002644 [Ogataea parapolymorpha]
MSSRRRSSVLRRMSVGSEIDSVCLEVPEINDSVNTKVSVSDFTPLKVLGQGAYGKVLLVKNKYTGRLFAQKELKKASIMVNSKTYERTFSERTILASISSHQNIVKLFYALHDDQKLYLILEYIPGGELFQHLAQRRFLDEKSASFYVAQMALALRHLHEMGAVYRDLKPENCLLDKDGYLVLTDFGLAKQPLDTSSENWCNSIIGTPEYCSPEVVRGDEYGVKTDWWSLGCVMFDLLTGSPPFTGNNHKTIIDRILKQKPKYPFYLTSDAKDLLAKLLNKNPQKRLDADSEWSKFTNHRFFRYFKWQDLCDRKVPAPIIPTITDPEKAENFDAMFTSQTFTMSEAQPISIPASSDEPDHFKGFSYTASDNLFQHYLSNHNS